MRAGIKLQKTPLLKGKKESKGRKEKKNRKEGRKEERKKERTNAGGEMLLSFFGA